MPLSAALRHRRPSPLLRMPVEVLTQIMLELVLLDPSGPPAHLLPILLTCKHLHHVLRFDNDAKTLYAVVFRATYDTSAAARRLGERAARSSALALQLRKLAPALRRIRTRDVTAPTAEQDLWTAFIMLSENDGKNMAQLEWAGAYAFADTLVRNRLRNSTGEWPAETRELSLALWCMWMMTTEERLLQETEQEREEMLDMLRPYVLMSCRYPAFQVPDNHYHLPLHDTHQQYFPHSLQTAHGLWPHYRDAQDITVLVRHFGHWLWVSTPLLSIAARMLYVARKQTRGFGIPPTLPRTRAHALELGQFHVMPTQEDLHEVNAHRAVALPLRTHPGGGYAAPLPPTDPFHGRPPSAQWDGDWARWAYAHDARHVAPFALPAYEPGLFRGLWAGRMLIPAEAAYMHLVTLPAMPQAFGDEWPFTTTAPIFIKMREHHAVSPEHPVWTGGDFPHGIDDGVRNGWFPEGTKFIESSRGVEVRDPTHDGVNFYKTYAPDEHNGHNLDTCMLIDCAIARNPASTSERLAAASLAADSENEGDDDAPLPPSSPATSPAPAAGDDALDLPDDVDFLAPADACERPVGAGLVEDDGHDRPLPECTGVSDVILTGVTDGRHAAAWHAYAHHGRVRAYDGLISLVREAVDRRLGQGRFIYRGYIVGGRTFIGTWRVWTADPSALPWEGPVLLSQRAE